MNSAPDGDADRIPMTINRRSALRWAGAAGLAGLAASALPGMAWGASPAAAEAPLGTFSPLRPPATPLAVRSMYLSTWQQADSLAGTWPTFWNGHITALTGIARVDGTAYTFAGAPGLANTMTQTALQVTATRSHYTLQGGNVQIDVTFFSPVDPDSLQRQSVPMSYVTVQASSVDGNAHRVSVYLDISGEWAHGDVTQQITWAQQSVGALTALTCTPANPSVLAEYGDQASWGTVVFAADTVTGLTWQIGQDTVVRGNAANAGTLPNTVDGNKPRAINNAWPVFGFNLDLGSVTGPSQQLVVCLGHLRTPAVSYLGSPLAPWWQTYWSAWPDMLTWFRQDLTAATSAAQQLENRLALDVRNALGTGTTATQYLALCSLALRQAFGGTELVNHNGTPWAFLKEISSDGNVSTIDVTYPAMPAYLYVSPSYLQMLLAPLLDYAENGGWPGAFAEHDIGSSYPNAAGHNTGGEEDMPVEESANMLIMAGALISRLSTTDATTYAQTHYTILHKWAEYLVANALDPNLQNQTDDFTGFIAHSANLALKGIIGIGAMGQIATAAGNTSDAAHYTSVAQSYTAQWQTKATDSSGQHLKLAYDQDGTWSLKYNGYPDKLLGTNLVPESVATLEANWYASHAGTYGIVLDPRNSYTKVDWELWTASWLNNHPVSATLIAGAYNFANSSATRVPLTDLYQVADASQVSNIRFQARPVVGGLFSLLTLRHAPNGLLAHWPLDGTGTDAAGNLNDATVTGGVTWTAGIVGGAATFNGITGSLGTNAQVVRTDHSFTVSAWALLTSTANFATVVSQDGAQASGFYLQYSAADNRWAFARVASDAANAASTRALSASAPQLGAWTHLTGVFDSAASQLRLYVNGSLSGSATYTSGWNATGNLQIGRGKWNGAPTDYFTGSIDEVRAWSRALTTTEATSAFHLGDNATARWTLDEATGNTATDVIGAHTATASGGFTWGTGYSGNGVTLNGSTGALSTAAAVIQTDQSFTVTAWAKLTSVANFATVVSQDGTQASGFYLQYSAADNRWAFARVASDVANAAPTRALSVGPPQAGAWTHLAGVYDGAAGQLSLYVNGSLASTVAYVSGWNATGSLQIGRGKWNGAPTDYFTGTIDEVRAWSRALSTDDIHTLI